MPPRKEIPLHRLGLFSHPGRKPRGGKAYEAISGKHRKGGPAPFSVIGQITADGIIYGDFSELNTATTPDD
ncbi:hypothetical protein ACIGT4_15915 [Streptomyces sioyaensis]|uniref:hypothetical protein n=1 Tax=Streptomyces sioyaensis TaxID=67364 RepID=UPI0037CFCA5B